MFGRGGAPNNARPVHEHFIAVDDREAARCTQRLAAREFPAVRVPARASLALFPAGKPAFIAGRLSPTSGVSRLTSMQSGTSFSVLRGAPAGVAPVSRGKREAPMRVLFKVALSLLIAIPVLVVLLAFFRPQMRRAIAPLPEDSSSSRTYFG
jgi:hypothetical protein